MAEAVEILESYGLDHLNASLAFEALEDAGFGLVKEAQAGALREAADELTWVRPEVSPCGDTDSCCGSVESCDAMQPSLPVVSATWLQNRAASIEGEA